MTRIESPILYATYQCPSGLVMHVEYSADDDTPPEAIKCPCPYARNCTSTEKIAELTNVTTISPLPKQETKKA